MSAGPHAAFEEQWWLASPLHLHSWVLAPLRGPIVGVVSLLNGRCFWGSATCSFDACHSPAHDLGRALDDGHRARAGDLNGRCQTVAATLVTHSPDSTGTELEGHPWLLLGVLHDHQPLKAQWGSGGLCTVSGPLDAMPDTPEPLCAPRSNVKKWAKTSFAPALFCYGLP